MCKGMTKVALFGCVAIALAFAGCGGSPKAGVKKDTEDVYKGLHTKPTLDPATVSMSEFFPMVAGTKYTYWRYEGLKKIILEKTFGAPSGGPRRAVAVTLRQLDKDGKPLKNKETGKVDTGTETYVWDPATGLSYFSGPNPTSATRVLPAKWQAGARWETEIDLLLAPGRMTKAKVRVVLGDVDRVETGFGIVDAITVKVSLSAQTNRGPVAIDRTWWLAKGIGIVKMVDRNGQGGLMSSTVLMSKS